MKGKYIFLAALLAISGTVVAFTGVVVKYAILEPLGLERPENVVALPFVLLRDEGLRYVITDLRGERQPEETPLACEPTGESSQPQELEPTETPSQPQPSEPTEVQLPQRDLLEKALFIGDSRTCGLRDHARLDGADYFCEVGMSVFNVGSKRLSDESFRGQTLTELLAEREYSCVFIGLGLNEAGYPVSSLIRAYQELLTAVSRTQPQAVIILQGVMTVSREWAQQTSYTSPEKLAKINERISALADEYRIYYVDANRRFADEEGYLPDNMTADGCHLYAKFTRLWSEWLCREVEKLDV